MNSYQGKLLVAEPSIFGDFNFHRSVVLLANHENATSLGFILNKPLDFNIEDIIPEIKYTTKIYYGGPVEPDNLYFIHNVPNLIPESIPIDSNIYWGGDFEQTVQLLNQNKINKSNIRFFLGYSGWGEGQLQSEIELNSWIVKDNFDASELINIESKSFWRKQIISMGGDYLIWGNTPENPNYN